MDRGGATATLLTSVVSALTCLGSFAVVMVDINYISGCCSLLEDNCEVQCMPACVSTNLVWDSPKTSSSLNISTASVSTIRASPSDADTVGGHIQADNPMGFALRKVLCYTDSLQGHSGLGKDKLKYLLRIMLRRTQPAEHVDLFFMFACPTYIEVIRLLDAARYLKDGQRQTT